LQLELNSASFSCWQEAWQLPCHQYSLPSCWETVKGKHEPFCPLLLLVVGRCQGPVCCELPWQHGLPVHEVVVRLQQAFCCACWYVVAQLLLVGRPSCCTWLCVFSPLALLQLTLVLLLPLAEEAQQKLTVVGRDLPPETQDCSDFEAFLCHIHSNFRKPAWHLPACREQL